MNDRGGGGEISGPPQRVLIYVIFRFLSRVLAVVLFDVRVRGLSRLPKSHGGIIAPNHTSFLDPWIVGLILPRILSYMARETLFRIPGFGWLLRSLNALPVVRGSNAARQGLKTGLAALKDDRTLVIFPEGTRSVDGKLQPLKRGIVLLARQSGLPVVPVYVEGSFEAWPRQRWLPRIGPVTIHIGEPKRIDPESGQTLGSAATENGGVEVEDWRASSEIKDGKDGDLQWLVDNGWAQRSAETRAVTPRHIAAELAAELSADVSSDGTAATPAATPEGVAEVSDVSSVARASVPVRSGSVETPLSTDRTERTQDPERQREHQENRQSAATFLESVGDAYRALREDARKRRRVAP